MVWVKFSWNNLDPLTAYLFASPHGDNLPSVHFQHDKEPCPKVHVASNWFHEHEQLK